MFWTIIYLVYVIIPIFLLLVGRILYIALKKDGKLGMRKSQSVKTLIVLGSGGHTTEILQIVKNLHTEQYTPRIYVHASLDKISSGKVHEIEKKDTDFEIIDISRSREVGQSYISSVWTTLLSLRDCGKILWNLKPDLILCNGPGTCVPICVATFLTRVMQKMCNLAPITGAQIPWDDIVENLRENIPIEIKIHLTPMCNILRSSLETNEALPQSRIDDSLLRLEACLDQTWEALNTGYWRNVSVKYRYCYTFCSAIKCIFLEIQCSASEECGDIVKREKLTEIIKQIDKAILLGAPLPKTPHLMTAMASRLNDFLAPSSLEAENNEIPIDESQIQKQLLPGFVWIKRFEAPSMETFYREIFMPKSPAILENCLTHWRALKSWKNLNYLMKIAGNRTVPIEIGSRYTEEDWSQSLVTFAEFIRSHVSKKNDTVGYLAQHQLFEQIPEMKEDFSIPDYCNFSDSEEEATPPDINAWFGPRGTVSPLHFDPKNNLLCQVFGWKRVIIYHPEESSNLYSYETRLLSNTAQVDPIHPNYEKWPNFKEARGFMCYLRPGDMLFIPPGWWHHVESLTPSFSISFWWC